MSLLMTDLHWAAGFLEGEGSFMNQRHRMVVTAVQVQREPLDRLQRIFGGTVRVEKRKEVRGGIYHRWHRNGCAGAGIAMTLYSLMSPRRQEQITKAITKWRSVPINANAAKSHCKRGHELAGENLRVYGGRRYCRACQKMHAKRAEG